MYSGKNVAGSSLTVARRDAAQRATGSFDFNRARSGPMVMTIDDPERSITLPALLSRSEATSNGARNVSIAWQRASGPASAIYGFRPSLHDTTALHRRPSFRITDSAVTDGKTWTELPALSARVRVSVTVQFQCFSCSRFFSNAAW